MFALGMPSCALVVVQAFPTAGTIRNVRAASARPFVPPPPLDAPADVPPAAPVASCDPPSVISTVDPPHAAIQRAACMTAHVEFLMVLLYRNAGPRTHEAAAGRDSVPAWGRRGRAS